MRKFYISSIVTLFLVLFLCGCKESARPVFEPLDKFTLNKLNVPGAEEEEAIFKQWIKNNNENLNWGNFAQENVLNPEILNKSLSLGSSFLVNNQKPAGNFNYEYDFETKTFASGDNQVRQAGALWGVALIFAYNQDPDLKKALDKSLEFFFKFTKEGNVPGSRAIFYKNEINSKTGTVALVSLGIIEYLYAEKAGLLKLKDSYRQTLEDNLRGYIQHLLSIQLENAHFADSYTSHKKTNYHSNKYNPYADGEVLLTLIKAVKYLGYEELKPVFEDSAFLIAKDYTMDQWPKDPDSNLTKGFYQWSSMAFWEYQDTGWKDSEYYGDYVENMAWWMIFTHRTLQRTRNTAYAYEGIIHAYEIAKSENNESAKSTLAFTIDRGLTKLTSWQVGGPLESRNKFLSSFNEFPPVAIGGIMNHRKEPLLRIDVTQHQMHSVILALKYRYNN